MPRSPASPPPSRLPGTPPLPAPARRSAARGRPAGRPADETRERILNAAEALFADNGFDGTSVRDIARAVAVQTAAVSYHYPSKDALFDSVVSRRAQVMTEQRSSALVQMRLRCGERPVPLDALVRAYVQPFVESASHGDPGWRHYAALMGRLANSPRGTEVIARHYDGMARAYLQEFRRSLPGVAEATVVNGFSVMVAAMLALCANTGRPQRLLSEGAPNDAPLADAFEHLVGFLVSGFLALPAGGPGRARRGAAATAITAITAITDTTAH